MTASKKVRKHINRLKEGSAYKQITFYYCECSNLVETKFDDTPTDFPSHCTKCGYLLDYGDE